MCRIWLTQHPKHKSGFELKQIAVKIASLVRGNRSGHHIDSAYKRQLWLIELTQWEEKHRDFINQKSYNIETGRYWYARKMVRRSFTVIKKALLNMFFYLKDDKIPNSKNSLESFFGHLKGNLHVHRGFSLANRKKLFEMVFV